MIKKVICTNLVLTTLLLCTSIFSADAVSAQNNQKIKSFTHIYTYIDLVNHTNQSIIITPESIPGDDASFLSDIYFNGAPAAPIVVPAEQHVPVTLTINPEYTGSNVQGAFEFAIGNDGAIAIFGQDKNSITLQSTVMLIEQSDASGVCTSMGSAGAAISSQQYLVSSLLLGATYDKSYYAVIIHSTLQSPE